MVKLEGTHKRIAIIGTVGVPGQYGGFETLADNLVRYHSRTERAERLTVYCSSKHYKKRPKFYLGAELRFLPISANGLQSIPFDFLSFIWSTFRRDTHIIVLGVSGCIFLPALRFLTRAKVICNIDGMEWRREKWRGIARCFLRFSEKLAVRYGDIVIADNEAISDYVASKYGRECSVIAYGGDHVLDPVSDSNISRSLSAVLPDRYALALCRIEPENNIALILEAWVQLNLPLVFVGNWDKSEYGRSLKERYNDHPGITLLDPIYDAAGLKAVRSKATLYVHGHSAGGTNPSLVEMMHLGIPVFAHGCRFNRETTENKAIYFLSTDDLIGAVNDMNEEVSSRVGADMKEVAGRKYCWDIIGKQYFDLLR